MHSPLILVIFALAVGTRAKQCIDLLVPFSLTARNAIFDIEPIEINSDATRFIQRLTSSASNYSNTALRGYRTVLGEYDLSARFCYPNSNSSASTLQFLTHGVGFDKLYWDLPYNEFNYSYVDVAVDQYGYSTFAIDRFGIGNSSIADPLTVVQAPAELAAIYQVTNMLRAGAVNGVPAPKNIVHVGHSFGSVLSYALVDAYPDASDGLVLTGFSPSNATLNSFQAALDAKLARLNQPLRFGDINAGKILPILNQTISVIQQSLRSAGVTALELQNIVQDTSVVDLLTGLDSSGYPHAQNLSSGYLAASDAGSLQYNFFYPNYFDPSIVTFVEANKQPVTTGELLTQGGSTPKAAPKFTGPVLVLNGSKCLIFFFLKLRQTLTPVR